MDLSTLNWLAIGAAALSSFLLGGLWYSPVLFGKAWQKACELSDDDLKNTNMGKLFGFSLVFALVMALNLGMFLNAPGVDLSFGAMAGFLTGFGWIAMAIAITGLFERRSWTYIAINAGYHTLSLLLMGIIIGVWR